MLTRRRTAPAAALTLLLVATLTTACTSSDKKTTDTLTWPKAMVLSDKTTQPFWIVWTAVADTKDGVNDELQPAVDALKAAGYDTLPMDPKCQTGAEELLAKLTGYTDPLAVGVPFATEQEAGNFNTLFDGAPVSVTSGTYTCGAA